MRRLLVIGLLVAAGQTAPAAVVGQRPNFAGKWSLLPQDATTLMVEQMGGRISS
jgi:hypothetical protein